MESSAFEPGLARVRHQPQGVSLELFDDHLLVFTLAGAAHAPGVIRPGVVLDARVMVHDPESRKPTEDALATIALRGAYLGAVIGRAPMQHRRVLQGEPLQDICADTAKQIRWHLNALELADQMA
ncbi:hypothetical protein ABS642_04065 [Microbacterium sp. A8/3-1]|uniref:Uncharacterized protein n=1 Tax=Microbacterium sp. A8/3-1 TaxID=3160749 RepID=A0AAU7VYW1_9MICO